MKSKYYPGVMVETSMLVLSCPICSSPIFFSWDNKERVICKKCHSTLKIIYNGKRFVVTTLLNDNDAQIRCTNPECNTVFTYQHNGKESEDLVLCPACGKLYYIKINNRDLYVKGISNANENKE